jgi:Ca2+-binding RTX toxin-like protein
MATPTSNSTSVSTFSKPSNDEIAGLVSDRKWGGSLGTGVTLTYSIPSGTAYHKANYGQDEWSAWSSLNATEISHFQMALAEYTHVANLNFTQVSDNSTTVGEIRIAKSQVVTDSGAAGWGYFPGSTPEAGDIWLDTDGTTFENGSYDYLTLIHEVGHALGLKHPFDPEPDGNWTTTLPTSQDNFAYTVMSYTADPGGNDALIPDRYPTSMMMLDIQAIQYLYGANHNYHSGNNTYTYSGTGEYWETIWDGGGTDTLVYNSTTGGVIDLRAGHWSQLGNPIVFRYPNATIAKNVYDTVAIAKGVTIENATGGDGADTIHGNSAANTLRGRKGTDRLFGHTGNDTLYGNGGKDKLYGHGGRDLLNGGSGADLMYGGGGNDTFVIDNKNDRAIENAGKGRDRIRSSITLTLFDNIETLILTGGQAINGTGNGRANTVRGNTKKNALHGKGAADKLYGDRGSDRLFGEGGTDQLYGGKGRDRLLGGAGNDKLTGGQGADTFRYNKPGHGGDTITDFRRSQTDKIQLVSRNFANLTTGSLSASNFVANTNGVAKDANDYFTFSTSKDILYFDADGNGAGAKVKIAHFSNGITLKNTDIVIVS